VHDCRESQKRMVGGWLVASIRSLKFKVEGLNSAADYSVGRWGRLLDGIVVKSHIT